MAPRNRTAGPTPVAITGACGGLGRAALHTLASDPGVPQVLAVDGRADVARLATADQRVLAHRVDLADPTSGVLLGEVFRKRHVQRVVHAAFSLRPRQDLSAAHELEVIGTLQLLTACAAAKVKKLVLLSTTMVYGASAQNPDQLSELMTPRGSPGFSFVQDKLEAEGEVGRFVRSHPMLQVTVLRFAPLLGPALDSLWTRYVKQRLAPTVLGRDPLMQFVHPADAWRAVRGAVREDVPGTFNVVGRGVLPLSTVLALAGTWSLPLPAPLAAAALGTGWTAGKGALPAAALDYLRYPCVADGQRAASALGFIPQFGMEEAVAHLMTPTPEPAHG
jgi:UDP-glucose 4-epimerase